MVFFENVYLNCITIVVIAVLGGVAFICMLHGLLTTVRTVFDVFDYPQMKKIRKMMIQERNKNYGNLSMEQLREIEKFVERVDRAAYYWHRVIELTEKYISVRDKFLGGFKKLRQRRVQR